MKNTICCALLLILLVSCMTWEHVPADVDLLQVFELGDLARVEQQDGTRIEFRVAELGPNLIAGEGHRYARDELVAIHSREIDELKTVGAVLGSAAVYVAVLGVLSYAVLTSVF